jgi:trehalose 6-phosphate phosphatase
VGGVRNWDYRFCWLRDAALTAASLVRLGSFGEAMRFLDWMLELVEEHGSSRFLSPVYTLSGDPLPSEAEITDLPGYRGSRPVRVGNAASGQIQLDVFGPVVDLVHLIMVRDAPITAEHWRLVKTMVARVEERWDTPDHGIWELRGQRRHHVHSKVMCWVTVDRACRIAREYLGRPQPEWARLRDVIAEDVRTHGWNEERGAYTAAYGISDLDASVLEIGLRGLVPGDDPRFQATVEAVEAELRKGPTVYRYRFDDGLPGFEGGLHICTSWLIQSLVLIGERERAADLFEEMLALAGPTGLLSEEYGPRTRRALGNHPQAYSHLGVIDAALCLATDAELRRP